MLNSTIQNKIQLILWVSEYSQIILLLYRELHYIGSRRGGVLIWKEYLFHFK